MIKEITTPVTRLLIPHRMKENKTIGNMKKLIG
jgi:hypothetical protein